MRNTKLVSLLLVPASVFVLSACGNNHKTQSHHNNTGVAKKANNVQKLRPQPNYKLSSERAPYPKLKKSDKIIVNIKKQRAYIFNSKKCIYQMYVSTGSHNKTPTGTYHINNYRTNWFYSPQEHEGAEYAVGWHEGGLYLFHATPANKNKKINLKVAHDLGKKPSSHGCIHLSLPDAKWFSNNAPVGMTVIIKR